MQWQTNISYYANPMRTEISSYYSAYFSPGVPDLSSSPGGALNGGYTDTSLPQPPWLTDSTSITYDTMGAIFTDGLPGSTNEHFYRIKLSLSDGRTGAVIPTYVVDRYLGQRPDESDNIYLWLQDASIYPGKPTFRSTPPSHYHYVAEPARADQRWNLVISTIRMGNSSTWPGERPPGMAQRMGFPSDEGYFSDEQLAFDYILNSPLTAIFTSLINAALASRGYPVWFEKDTSRGQVGTLPEDDRKFLVMALLSRSTNPDPPAELDGLSLTNFIGTNFAYRLLNEFGVEAVGFNDKFPHDVAGRHIQRKRAEIGKTKIEFKDDVIARVKIWPGTVVEHVLELGFDKADVNNAMHLASGVWFMTNAPGAGHNTLHGGAKGSPSITHFCSGRAGPVLVLLEQPLLRKMPPDFSCSIIYKVIGNVVGPVFDFSLNNNTTWPTFFTYEYDFESKTYKDRTDHPQIETPFNGFLSLGP